MRKLRTCASAQLSTGVSKCPPDFGKMKGAIVVEYGTKLPKELTADKLEELAHADRPNRIYGIVTFCEYAKNGGEVQTAANGYGPEQVTGVSSRKDTFDLDKFHPELQSSLLKCSGKQWGAYFFDEEKILYGINDGTDELAPYPMSTIYSDSTPIATSSAKPTMNVTFAHEDAKLSITEFDFVQLDFNPLRLTLGLTAISLEKVGTSGNGYKIVEKIGGNDITAIYGPLIAEAGATVINGTTSAVAYDVDSDTITITSAGNDVSLKSASVLFANDIKGIEQVK